MSNPAESMVWHASNATLHGKVWPRATAAAPDDRAAIEIIGPPERIKQVAVVGQIVDTNSASQVAAYMVMAMRLIAPQWAGATTWLQQSLRAVERRGPQAITMCGWRITMGFLSETHTVTLQATH
jgi:hypothetical protein